MLVTAFFMILRCLEPVARPFMNALVLIGGFVHAFDQNLIGGINDCVQGLANRHMVLWPFYYCCWSVESVERVQVWGWF